MKTKILIVIFLVSLTSFAQEKSGKFQFLNVTKSLYSTDYNLIYPNADSVGQFHYENMADPENDLDGVNRRTLNSHFGNYAVDSSYIKTAVREWDLSVAKNITTDDTTRWGLVIVDSMYFEGLGWKYPGDSVSLLQKNAYSITLPYSTTIAGRIALAVEGTDYPAGWVLEGDGLNLVVTHNLGRFSSEVTVMANTSGTVWQRQLNTAAYSYYSDLSSSVIEVFSLCTATKPIKVIISFLSE
jgi:hypothetical protein